MAKQSLNGDANRINNSNKICSKLLTLDILRETVNMLIA